MTTRQAFPRSISALSAAPISSRTRFSTKPVRLCGPSTDAKRCPCSCHILAPPRERLWTSRSSPSTLTQIRRFRTSAMAQQNSMQQLWRLAEGLSLDSVAAEFPQAHPEHNPHDVYRAHLSNVISRISGVEPKTIFPVVMWTSGLDKGDFVVAVPALKVKNQKPNVLASEWASKVLCWHTVRISGMG